MEKNVSSPLPDLYAVASGSALSGMLSRIPLHPLDTIKSQMQVQTSNTRGELLRVLGRARSQGVTTLYRGFPIAFVGSAPASLLYFSTYELAKRFAARETPSIPSAVVHLTAGMLAEAVSCVFWVPIDVIKERQQVQGVTSGVEGSRGAGTLETVRTIIRTEGLRGIYKGYGATLASFGPFSALYFTFYEKLKVASEGATNTAPGSMLPLAWQIGCASSAGAGASVLTSPLDLVKLRLQVQRGFPLSGDTLVGSGSTPWGAVYTGIPHALREIVRSEGPLALFRGAGARVAFHSTSTALTMTLFETCKESAAKALLSAS